VRRLSTKSVFHPFTIFTKEKRKKKKEIIRSSGGGQPPPFCRKATHWFIAQAIIQQDL
jgi:hypothetical protein